MSTEQAGAKEEAGRAKLVVLVVEDERAISSFVAEVVRDAGHLAVVVRNGHQALEWTRAQWPDLVVTDLMMPHLDGASLVRALRLDAAARGSTMPPVIIMTAASPTYARTVGADALLRKPFDLVELDALLRRFLDRAS